MFAPFSITSNRKANAFNCIHCDYTTQPYTVSYTSSFPVADSRTFPYAVSNTFSNSVSYAVAKSHTCADSAAGMHQPTRIARSGCFRAGYLCRRSDHGADGRCRSGIQRLYHLRIIFIGDTSRRGSPRLRRLHHQSCCLNSARP